MSYSKRCNSLARLVLVAALAPVSLSMAGTAAAQSTESATQGAAGETATSASALVYDVASIKPNLQGPGSVRVSTNLDVYVATNVSLVDLLQDAYDLRPGMFAGQPKWADADRFDIHAKILDATVEQLRNIRPEDRKRMLRVLLVDRFQLVTHMELKTLQLYDLLQVKSGAKVEAISPQNRNDAFMGVSSGSLSVHNGRLAGHYLPMKSLADFLASQVGRPVIDKTGMDAKYNLQLIWARDDAPAAEDSAAPPMFKALQEQLGLRLEAAREPVEVLVVDHVAPPTEN